jgi:hypothetical protein
MAVCASVPSRVYDTALAIGFNILKALCGPLWQPTEVLLSERLHLGFGGAVKLGGNDPQYQYLLEALVEWRL